MNLQMWKTRETGVMPGDVVVAALAGEQERSGPLAGPRRARALLRRRNVEIKLILMYYVGSNSTI